MLWYIHQRAIFAIRQYRRCGPVHVNKWTGVIFAWMSALLKNCLYHTVIPPWIYRIPSELRSQAGLGLPSTVVGDHTGIVSAVCYNFCIIIIIFKMENQSRKFEYVKWLWRINEGTYISDVPNLHFKWHDFRLTYIWNDQNFAPPVSF